MASAINKVNKINQIARLKHAVRGWKNKSLTRGGLAPGYSSSSDSDEPLSPRRRTPAGSFAVYVGTERHRFVVPTRFLNLPVFVALLDQAEEEFGYQSGSGLALPCGAGFFSGVLRLLEEDEERFRGLDLEQFLKMANGTDLDPDMESVDRSFCKQPPSPSAITPSLHDARV